MELYPTEIHLGSFLEGVVAIMRMRAQEKDILFVYEPDAALPIGVHVDEKRLRQVLLNLLGNAIKFTHRGQVTLKVSSCRGDALRSPLRFEVIDTGVGMTPSQLAQIFLPFEQVGDAKQRAQGTGLGLAITRQLVTLMGGEVQVVSQLGEGSRFCFELSLPVVTVQQKSQLQKTTQHIVGYEGPKRHILVVDDRAENRLVLCDLLKPLGFKITEAENGLQEVTLARQTQPDLILTDIMMPLMNGFEAVKEIRQFSPELPIIAISASVFAPQGDDNIEQKQSKLAGCNAFLPKPVDTTKLLELIEQLLPLQWIYEQNRHEPRAPKGLLIAPPPDLLSTLHELASLGMMSGIRKQAAHLEELDAKYAPFAKKLLELARGFEDEKILALIEQQLPNS
jgi:CheY-like chemotaxis protein/anti-sigma regulatory factor (Ser/Thr protein kinase)